MIQSTKEVVEWWVVFRDSQVDHWIMKWINPSFQHCYAMRKSAGGQMWVVVDPQVSYTSVTTELVDDYPHPRLYAGEKAVILRVECHIDPSKKRHTLCVFNCVEVVKSLLGIRAFWIWTPRQLYERLTNGR